jgi:mersacidin/lichenicidin family type 2 lantibiotic
METTTIIRAWKDPEFRKSLSSEQRAALPESPSGQPMTELNEGELGDVVGGGLPGGPLRFTLTKRSAIDACPSALVQCDFTWRQQTIRELPVLQVDPSVLQRQF